MGMKKLKIDDKEEAEKIIDQNIVASIKITKE